MGVVLAAYDTQLDRKVALKFLHRPSEADPREETRLLREAQAMARLTHPNVIAIYQVGTYRSTIYFAMELIEGRTLRAWQADAPRGWREIVAVHAQAGRGLAEAHRHGIVHRDFKPDNVLVEDAGRVLVTDFGVAALSGLPPLPAEPKEGEERDVRLTDTGMVVGTPAYMAPEQHRREATDARADQFSFCVALYEALNGKRP